VYFDVKWSRWLAENIPGNRRRVEFKNARLFFPEELAGFQPRTTPTLANGPKEITTTRVLHVFHREQSRIDRIVTAVSKVFVN